MPTTSRKKAGCTSYANVTDDYMLYNAAVNNPASVKTTTTGGNKRSLKNRRGGTNDMQKDSVYTLKTHRGGTNDMQKDSVYTLKTHRGGYEGTNGLQDSANALLGLSSGIMGAVNQGLNQLTGNQASTIPPSSGSSVNSPQFVSYTVPSVTSQVQQPQVVSKGGRGGCGTCGSKKGGAVELAPFAASLAFLAARMSMDDKLNFSNLLNFNDSVHSSTSRSTRRSTRK